MPVWQTGDYTPDRWTAQANCVITRVLREIDTKPQINHNASQRKVFTVNPSLIVKMHKFCANSMPVLAMRL